MSVIRTWREPYVLDRCPRCATILDAPDDDLARHCPICGITVEAQLVELHVDD